MKKNNLSSEFVYVRTYARWDAEKKRRETWPESCKRYCNFILQRDSVKDKIPEYVKKEIPEFILEKKVMPAMRAFWAAGPAAEKNNAAIYNCAALGIQSIDDFGEAVFLLMSGCGVGYSVEKKYIKHLPVIAKKKSVSFAGIYIVDDSKEGWADSIKQILTHLYAGESIEFDYSLIRPAGSRLLVGGGKASGPEPLIKTHRFIRDLFNRAQGRRLTSLEVSDIMNNIAEMVVVGGVRRSAQIALSDLDDEEMATSKHNNYPDYRSFANVSAVYRDKPSPDVFMTEFANMINGRRGERGIFNLSAIKKHNPGRRTFSEDFITNPCGEIILSSHSFCNLSEIIVRCDDTIDTLLKKAEVATWLGMIQSTMTDFTYLRPVWKENCDNNRLIGVSLTGIMDNFELLNSGVRLRILREKVISVAKEASEILNISMPVSTTCIKPSGTVSQIVDSSSGIHPRYAPYYIRRYRIARHDPLLGVLRECGVKLIPDIGMEHLAESKEFDKITSWVVEFPIKSPEDAVFYFDSFKQLELYRLFINNYVEHNASITIYVKPDHWVAMAARVFNCWHDIKGITFLPVDGGHHYKLAPYQAITKSKYEEMVEAMPFIDYNLLSKYENGEDCTTGEKMLACTSGHCEI